MKTLYSFSAKTYSTLCLAIQVSLLTFCLVIGMAYGAYPLTTQTFNYTGSYQTWTVPAGVTSITIDAYGAQGGSGNAAGGLGGYASGVVAVTPGQVLYIYVGGQNGYNGGGTGGLSQNGTYGGTGGGASDVRATGTALSNRIIVAGGGGGGGRDGSYSYCQPSPAGAGGSGGGTAGANGYSSSCNCFGGGTGGGVGTSSAGGAAGTHAGACTRPEWYAGTAGSLGSGGTGSNCVHASGSGGAGGGGGGYFGGGAGGNGSDTTPGGGGGGGSSNTEGVTNASSTSGSRSGNGLITISYTISSPTITTTGTFSAFSTCAGTASSEQSITASGSGLTANITVTAPTGFELSTTSGGSFSNTLTLTQTGGTVSNTTIYVRMASSASGSPSGNVTLASTGATTQNVAVSGTAYAIATVSAGPDQTICSYNTSVTLAGSIGGSAASGSWSGGTGSFSPDASTLNATYFPSVAEVNAGSVILTLSSDDPSGPCGSVSDQMTISIGNCFKITSQAGDWNSASTWTPEGEPLATENITILHAVTVSNNAPASPAVCRNMFIGAGSIVVNSGQALTVFGSLSNGIASKLVVGSGGSFIESTAAIQATVECYMPSLQWHFISAPVSDAVSNMFFDKYLQQHTESSNAFSDILTVDVPLYPMKGFALWGGDAGFTTSYTGILNTGYESYNTTYSGVGKGWNLVGNPYPSAIDWDAAAGWTKTAVNNATYLHVNQATWASYVGGVQSNGGSRYIAPAQGFFVRASDAGVIAMTDAVRTHHATSFFKNSEEEIPNLVRLEISGNNYKDEAVVRFLPGATAEFDGDYDAYKLFGDVAGAAQVYTTGSTALSINSLPETNMVPVGVKIDVSGTYTIAATEINDLQYVSLEDTQTGIFTELAKSPYTFSFETGENELRFKLHFSALGIGDNQPEVANIYSYRKTVFINLKSLVKGDIYIYNISGQIVAHLPSATGSNRINLENTGNYIVKVISDKRTIVKKVFIH